MRYARLMLAAALVVMSMHAFAEELPVPDFKAQPIKYKSRHGGELLIGDRTATTLTFWFNVEGANYHQCYMAGQASSGDRQTYRYVENECVLDIVLVEHSAVLIDSANLCQQIHCGSRAYINGAVFRHAK